MTFDVNNLKNINLGENKIFSCKIFYLCVQEVCFFASPSIKIDEAFYQVSNSYVYNLINFPDIFP